MKTIILILLCLLLIACNKEEPEVINTSEYSFHCVPDLDADSLNTVYYFQVDVGDSTDGLSLIDHDTSFIIGQTGSVPRDIETLCDLDGKYCQMFCFYIGCSYQYIPCCFFAKKR